MGSRGGGLRFGVLLCVAATSCGWTWGERGSSGLWTGVQGS